MLNFRDFFLKEANITSDIELLKQIDQELNEKDVASDSPIRAWFKSQYVKWIKSNVDDDKKPLKKHEYQQGEPEWMSKEGIMDFAGFNDQERQKLAHMVDYFKTLSNNDLKSLYKEPMAVIQAKMADWEKQMSSKMEKKKASPLVQGTDFEVIHTTKDANGAAMQWVKLLTKAAFKFEGDAMGHCVGGYNPAKKGLTIISLYDFDGLPHVTLEVQKKDIKQIKGKQNAAPIDKYQKPCIDFVRYLTDKQGYKVTGDGDNIGMMEYEGKYYFEDSELWKKVFEKEIVPKQQAAFEEIKKRIKIVASESFEYIQQYAKLLLKEDCRRHV